MKENKLIVRDKHSLYLVMYQNKYLNVESSIYQNSYPRNTIKTFQIGFFPPVSLIWLWLYVGDQACS